MVNVGKYTSPMDPTRLKIGHPQRELILQVIFSAMLASGSVNIWPNGVIFHQPRFP